MVNDSIASTRDALATFLTTLLGEEHPLTIEAKENEKAAQAASDLDIGVVMTASSGDTRVAIGLEVGFLSMLSQAMLGDALQPGDEGADDLLKELAAQAFGAVRSSLSGIGKTTPDLTFAPSSALSALELLGDDVVAYRAKYSGPNGTLKAIALVDQVRKSAPAPVSFPTISTSGRTPSVNVAPAAFPELGHEAITSGDGATFGLLAEVELEVTVELGRRRLALADVLRLTTGSVIELEKLVGEPLQVYANNRLIAEGEAVVIDEQFGIRITNLISSARRTKAFI
jgi:flagellar motor switch protein FliN